RNRSAAGEILLHKRTNDIALKAVLMIHDVVRNADRFRNTTCVIDIIERATATLNGLGHALVTGEAALVPELHGQADDVVTFGAQHGRNGRGVNSSRHGNGNGSRIRHSTPKRER